MKKLKKITPGSVANQIRRLEGIYRNVVMGLGSEEAWSREIEEIKTFLDRAKKERPEYFI